jgi:rhodanese-related sulfurtransferase
MSAVARISPLEAHDKMEREGFTYVDVRTPDEFADGHPAGATNVPFDDDFVSAMTRTFPKDAPLILGCEKGNRSLAAAKALVAAGYTNVLEQRAGYDAARGPFGEITEPGWSRLDLPRDSG